MVSLIIALGDSHEKESNHTKAETHIKTYGVSVDELWTSRAQAMENPCRVYPQLAP